MCEQASHYRCIPIITFDQPLWFKALNIVHNEPNDSELKSIVLRLGAFHMQMSYLGCIGHLMVGTGLREVLELIYAGNAVDHIMYGKAVSRAVRGHMLIDGVLNAMLLSTAYSCDIHMNSEADQLEATIAHPDLEEIQTLLASAIKEEENCSANIMLLKRLMQV